MTEHMHAVSAGNYSDYRVLCIAPTKEDAEAIVARYNATLTSSYYDEARVEEFPVHDRTVTRNVSLHLSTTLWDDGRETDQRENTSVDWPFGGWDEHLTPVQSRWVRAPMHNNKGGRLDVKGIDHERVRKVFSDLRAALITDDALRAQVEFSAHRWSSADE